MDPLRLGIQHSASGAVAVRTWLPGLLLLVAVTGCRGPGSAAPDANLERAAQTVARGEDVVQPQEFARWVIAGRKDYVLVDLRPAAAFGAGHIDGAQNLRLPELVAPAAGAAIPADRPLIVYAGDAGGTAASAALLLAAGRNARALAGGYDGWSREVLHAGRAPTAGASESPAAVDAQAMGCYFVGGPPRAAPPPESSKSLQSAPFVPPLSEPGAPAAKKKREGC